MRKRKRGNNNHDYNRDDEIDVRNLLIGGYMYVDDDGNISLFSHDKMYEEWELMEDNENS